TPDAYLGREQDTGARGLVYLRNRYYDPYTGRFTQEDPIGFAGGINLYAYAGNNPASYTDPFGLCPDEDPECAALEAAYAATGAAIGFWLGGGAGAIEALATGGTLAPAIALQAAAASGVGAALGGLVGNVVYFAKSSTSGNSPAAQSGRARH